MANFKRLYLKRLETSITDGHNNWWDRCQKQDCDLHITRPGEADCHHDNCLNKEHSHE